MPLAAFHPAVSSWFTARFGTPTEAQSLGWPAIAAGRDTLVAAPTGSGKTLAAFLACLDGLVRKGAAGRLPDGVEVLYVSPLKALGNDIERNLDAPLRGIGDAARALGLDLPEIRVAVRSGDTRAGDRAKMANKPPHILITTPESLFILLTSERGRTMLGPVRTVIVDEIHAVAGSKRGSHLALSLERLDARVVAAGGTPPVRVGLSATQAPIEQIARLLVGAARPLPQIVDTGHSRAADVAVELPEEEPGAVASGEMMGQVYDRIAALVGQHRTTLVFVNTRRMVERVAFALEKRLGSGRVAAHHGSLARDTRLQAEQRLKRAEVPCVVATASLELGIDVGEVELVVQIGSPRSIATFVQRVGRSGHFRGGTPKGRLFATTRDQLVECAALVRSLRAGVLDTVVVPESPLDILAQQVVAAAACEDWDEDALFDLVRRASPFAALPRGRFNAVLAMLAEGVATARGRSRALLHRDRVHGRVRGRRGARLAAVTSGGAIPDRADYAVIAAPDEARVGTVGEDFAVESMAGDVFLLGNASWRILRVEAGQVRVEDARGAPPTIPFWLGEAPARTAELSREVGRLRAEVEARLAAGDPRADVAADLARDCALPAWGAVLLVEYLAASRGILGALPTDRTLVAERFFDEAGGMQLVLHCPLGGRLNRALGLALRKRFCRTFDFELQAAATDDGVVLSLGPDQSFPLEDVWRFLAPENAEEVLTQAVLTGPMFGTRWRWNATRSLSIPRWSRGGRVPAPLLRMRSDDLLAAVFPTSVACFENVVGDIVPPDHPLVEETLKDCLHDAMDARGLVDLLRRIGAGEVRTVSVDTPEPSPLSHEILNANPYAFLDDAPLEERRTRAVLLRRGLPQVAGDLGALDPAAIARVVEEVAPLVRDSDELHDHLLTVGLLPVDALGGRGDLLADLVRSGRAVLAWPPGQGAPGKPVAVATERQGRVRAAAPGVRFEGPGAAWAGATDHPAEPAEEATAAIVRGHLEGMGPVTAAGLAGWLGLRERDVDAALAVLEGQGAVLRGRFTAGAPGTEWCDRRILARIHRATLDRLRREIEPVTAADLLAFLFRWQGVEGTRPPSRVGLAGVIVRLQGFEAPAGAWERDLLPARLKSYDPADLDGLCWAGEVAWARLSPRPTSGAGPTRTAPISLVRRPDLAWLLDPADEEGGARETLGHPARDVLRCLESRGASFPSEIQAATGRLPAEVDGALGELVGCGWITADGFGALRGLLAPAKRRQAAARRPGGRTATRGWRAHGPSGRWAVLRRGGSGEGGGAEAFARLLLKRYGVVFRELLARETRVPPWREVQQALRRMEGRGEVRGGRFVSGFVGEQFALDEAVDLLRAARKDRARGEGRLVRVAAADPLNLVGILTPGARVAAHLDNAVLYRDGVPLAAREGGRVTVLGALSPGERVEADLSVRGREDCQPPSSDPAENTYTAPPS